MGFHPWTHGPIRPWTLLVRQHPRDAIRVLVGHGLRTAERALALGGLAREDVPLEGGAPAELAGARLLEPLGGASVRLQLRHDSLTLALRRTGGRSRLRSHGSALTCRHGAAAGLAG